MKKRGFSLLEIVLAVALVTLVFSGAMFAFESIPAQHDLSDAARAGETLLWLASARARAMSEDDSWGVHFANDAITLYKGTSFASRDTSFDERISVFVTVSGTTDYVFSKGTGYPLSVGETTLSSDSLVESRTISASAYGAISSRI
ncbi:MAG: hypothetical protein ABA06_00065 [Parcubacteria bacterium C7867-001]|nr:MAG: hypothetical protein ABA06_00065 [Parcubacteria bacterium C7867-001]